MGEDGEIGADELETESFLGGADDGGVFVEPAKLLGGVIEVSAKLVGSEVAGGFGNGSGVGEELFNEGFFGGGEGGRWSGLRCGCGRSC